MNTYPLKMEEGRSWRSIGGGLVVGDAGGEEVWRTIGGGEGWEWGTMVEMVKCMKRWTGVRRSMCGGE